eukprot:416608_1
MNEPSAKNLNELLERWDNGRKLQRKHLLYEFVMKYRAKTPLNIEEVFGEGASLFFTRILTWLRLTYLLRYAVPLQLETIYIFLTSTCGQRFLNEFIDVGGIGTILEIISSKKMAEVEKQKSFKILDIVCKSGRPNKEALCRLQGIQQTAKCLCMSEDARTQESARSLLIQLGTVIMPRAPHAACARWMILETRLLQTKH